MHETGWETLSNRRKKHKLFLFYRMQHQMSPDYLSSLVPPTIGSTTDYQLRNSSDLLTLHASSQLYFNYFLPSVIREWNELPEITRELPSIPTFKHELNLDTMKIPIYSCLTYSDALAYSEVFRFYIRRKTKFRRNILMDIFVNTYWMKAHTIMGSFLHDGY